VTGDWTLQEISEFFAEPPIDLQDTEQAEEIYDVLVQADTEAWDEIEDGRRIQLTGVLYNLSEDLGRTNGLDRIIELDDEQPDEQSLAKVHQAMHHYQLANAHALRDAWTDEETAYSFFDSEDLIHAIGHARASIAEEYRPEVGDDRLTQSYVNFANLLSRTGRVCEALIWYNKAVSLSPQFGMALGNRGKCKVHYAAMLFSDNHRARFLHSAYNDFEQALEHSEGLHPRAERTFRVHMGRVSDYSDDALAIENEDEYELGDSGTDQEYHQWVLDHHLYLNPLNDIYTHTATAHDPFHLPNMMKDLEEEFPYPGLYNQMKQEFVSARHIYYEGLVKADGDSHFSDRDVQLPNTLDYTIYGYRTEQLKTALRMSYSIFDKIGTLINAYFDVGQHRPGFHEAWNEDGDYQKGLAEPFQNSDNWALNALYWVKKDFHHSISKRDEESVVVVAHELRSLRTAIEHDYIKVFEDSIVSEPPDRSWLSDSLHDAIGKSELRQAALEMLRLSRAALIYVSLAIHHEEKKKREEHDGPAVPMGGQTTVPDDFKQ
jgi:tetratricopeptide (TPR) repeat protein